MAKFNRNSEEVQNLVKQKYLNIQKHPSADLWLLNYSKSCQSEKIWNDITCLCRGLIVDSENNIVARPFQKFFNYEELPDKSVIPNLPFEVYEKLDGSLGILYWIGDEPHITTKGSFTSEQGKHGDYILHSRYSQYFKDLDKTKTYLFEIIWNEDHHCVSYGSLDDIFLLAVINTDSGHEEDIYRWGHIFKCTKRYDGIKNWKTIREIYSGDNREGFVVRFSNNFRIKMKYESYFRIHFLRCMLSEKYVLEFLIKDDLDTLLKTSKDLDEENQIYVLGMVKKFQDKYKGIENTCLGFMNTLDKTLPELEQIKKIREQPRYGVIFKMFRGQPYSDVIWKMIKKEYKARFEDEEY